MEVMRQSWTDERLDDFRGEVGRRFDQVDRQFAQVDQRFDRVERSIDGLRAESRTEFNALRSEMKSGFDRLHRLMVQFSGLMIAALIGLMATQL
jgi:hypothetical protein